jgi:RHS repeat-associated protein
MQFGVTDVWVIADGDYAYDALGIPVGQSGDTETDQRFEGREPVKKAGMYYQRARYYKPETGRFWTMDTYQGNIQDPRSLHKYLYCHGDGVNFSDPSGRYEGLGGLAISMGIQGAIGGFVSGAIDLAAHRSLAHARGSTIVRFGPTCRTAHLLRQSPQSSALTSLGCLGH